MANPLLVANLGIQAAAGLSNYFSGLDAYEASEKAYKANAKLINEELTSSYSENLLRAMQEMMALKTTLEDQERERLKQRGTAITAAGEAGVGGNSVDALLGDLEGQAARFRDRARQQTEWNLGALKRERRSLYNAARRQRASLPRSRPPDLMSSVLGTGAGMSSTFLSYNK